MGLFGTKVSQNAKKRADKKTTVGGLPGMGGTSFLPRIPIKPNNQTLSRLPLAGVRGWGVTFWRIFGLDQKLLTLAKPLTSSHFALCCTPGFVQDAYSRWVNWGKFRCTWHNFRDFWNYIFVKCVSWWKQKVWVIGVFIANVLCICSS